MFELLMDSLESWNANKSERQKLQHTYLVLIVIVVLIAGVVSLVNGDLGQTIVRLALIALLTYSVNAIVWNLLQSSVLDKLSDKPKSKKK